MPGPDPPTVVVVASLPVDSHIWIPGLACPALALYRQVQRSTLNVPVSLAPIAAFLDANTRG